MSRESDIHSQDRNPVFDSPSFSNISIAEGRGYFSIAGHHTHYESGLANEEIARYGLDADEMLEVWRLGCQLDGGGTNGNVVVDVYDAGSMSQIATVSAGGVNTGDGDPVGRSDPGSDVILRLSTGGSSVDITLTALLNITT